jgi:hypothetical protein
MAEHYNNADRARTRPILEMAIEAMLPEGADVGPWKDLDDLTAELGLRPGQVGTLKSKLRELNDVHHAGQPLRLETMTNPDRPRGAWLYRIVRKQEEPASEPCQLSLLEA